MQINCIVVLYNKKIRDSSTLTFFIDHPTIKNIKVLVYDNSISNLGNKKEALRYGWDYLSSGKNVGISKAYNIAIKYTRSNSQFNDDTTYFMLLDDDANLKESYFIYLRKTLKKSRVQIGVPIIKVNNQVLSPARVGMFGRISLVNDVSVLSRGNITAINNGMVIKANIFDSIHYNNNLFIDYVDHDFMRQARESKIKITVFNYVLNHNMSIVDESINEKSRLMRFKIFCSDLKKYYSENLFEKCFVEASLMYRGIKYWHLYHNVEFLKVVLKSNNKND